MKKKAAAALLLAGMLCVLPAALTPETHQPDPSGSAHTTEKQEEELPTLSEYINKGDSVMTALENNTSINRLIPFTVDGHCALANQDAVPVTDAVYDQVKRFAAKSGTLWVLYQEEQVTCVSETGALVLPETEGTLTLLDGQYLSCGKADGSTEIYRSDGTLAVTLNGKPHSCQNGVLVSKNTDGSWSLTDTERWKTIVVPNVRRIGAFSGGKAIVKLSSKNWGVIDSAGKITQIPNVVHLWDVCSGYVLAKSAAGTYGVLTTNGKEALPFEYSRANVCSEDYPIYQLWTADGDCVVRNVKSRQSLRLPSEFDGQKLTVWSNHYYSFSGEDGSLILFDDLGKLSFPGGTKLIQQNEDLMIAINGDSVSIVRLNDGEQSKPLEASYVPIDGWTDAEQSYVVLEDPQTGLRGISDHSGEMVIPMEYDSIYPTGCDLFAAEQDGRYGLIDARGRWKLCLRK